MKWSVSLCFQRLNGNLQILFAFSHSRVSFSSFLFFQSDSFSFSVFFFLLQILSLHLLLPLFGCVIHSVYVYIYICICVWVSACLVLYFFFMLFPFLLHLQRPHFIVDAIASFSSVFPAFILLSFARSLARRLFLFYMVAFVELPAIKGKWQWHYRFLADKKNIGVSIFLRTTLSPFSQSSHSSSSSFFRLHAIHTTM